VKGKKNPPPPSPFMIFFLIKKNHALFLLEKLEKITKELQSTKVIKNE
jgi:hypothetical protein